MLELANILHSKGFSIAIIHTNFNSLNPSTRNQHYTYHSIPVDLTETEASMKDLTRSSFSDTDSDDHHHSMTSHRLNQSQLVLEYDEHRDHYDLCNSHLRNLTNELDSLRRENVQLRSANTDLVKLLSSQAAFQSFLRSSSSSSAYQSPTATSFLDDDIWASSNTGELGMMHGPTSILESSEYKHFSLRRLQIQKILGLGLF